MTFTSTIETIALIGAGQVATHIGRGFISRGIRVKYVHSRNDEKAGVLAHRLGARVLSDVSDLQNDVDLVLIAINDDSIPEIAALIPQGHYVVAHTSGFRSLDILQQHHKRCGIIYPLQTFTFEREVDLRNVPFCLEASDDSTSEALEILAGSLTTEVHFIDSKQRKWLHVAAVFACNFSNYLYSVADEILQSKEMSLSLLQPLIEETAKKIAGKHPFEMQTGPVIRGDMETLKKHQSLLQEHPEYLQIYNFLTQQIHEQHNRKKL